MEPIENVPIFNHLKITKWKYVHLHYVFDILNIIEIISHIAPLKSFHTCGLAIRMD